MELEVVGRWIPSRVCPHGVALAPLDVYLAQSDGTTPRSMYCPECRRQEQDEIDAVLAELTADAREAISRGE
jgi:hypothetical protein